MRLRVVLCVLAVVAALQMLVWTLRFLLNATGDGALPGHIEAVIVPGGGVRANGDLPPWVIARFDAAMRIPANLRGYIVALSAGTFHRAPPRDQNGFPITEARAGAAYLLYSGINASQILTEDLSLDTIGNAFWLRLLHTEPRHWRRLHVVTNHFHAARTRFIFELVFGLPMLDADRRRWFAWDEPYELTFEAVENVGLVDDVLRERERREAASLEALKRGPVGRVRSMQDLHRFLHTKHDAYRIGRDFGGEGRVQGKAIDSY
jgi:uncharacterized SAM-binding protein YcdF (DUF218 family)